MKIITEYFEFVKKSKLSKINEGGGAGKEIKLEASFEIELLYTKSGIKEVKKYLEVENSMDIIGYQDGMRGISTDGIFNETLNYNINVEQLSKITMKDIRYNVGNDFMLEYSDETTLSDIINKGIRIPIKISGSGDLKKMYGRGWTTPVIRKNDTISFDTDNFDGLECYMFGKNIYDLMDCTITIDIKFTEKGDLLWNDLFFDNDGTEEYQDYLRDEYGI